MYSRLPITRTFKGNSKSFELSGVQVIEGKIIIIENDVKGNENWFELSGVDCMPKANIYYYTFSFPFNRGGMGILWNVPY